jgi:DNA (cytosine-5)-methyltransferase 1
MATVTDLFCGAGGSSLGAELAGGELRLALNHWPRAIETHAANFEHADHDCNDISALTTARIRGYPDSDILLASPECVNHSLAKGGKRRAPRASSLFDDGPAGDDEQERSRATMWDVVRFADQKLSKGAPYKAIIVENVPDAFWWGPPGKGYACGDGSLFDAWLTAMAALGYRHEIVWLNSMFAGTVLGGRPVPQSRDRMYVNFWRKGAKAPNLRVEPMAWCPPCRAVVAGRQTFKPQSLKKSGGRLWGKYGQQYFYTCPDCAGTVFPGAVPAAAAIDWSLPIQRIGDRERPLQASTRGRIRRGWEKVRAEPFALRIGGTGNPRPLTLPLMTQTSRHEAAIVFPNAGNTFERTPGNRARDTSRTALDTMHTSLERALAIPPSEPSKSEEAGTSGTSPVAVNSDHGETSALIVRNNGDKSGEQSTPAATEPIRTLTRGCHQSLMVPYYRTGCALDPAISAVPTVPTKDRLALVVPSVEELGRPVCPEPPAPVSEEDVDNCSFRMLDLPEIAMAMAMHHHVDGRTAYSVHGNRRERMAQYGNAVTPPAMELLVSRHIEVLNAA